MTCPECGKSIDAEQNFCRECGKELIADSPSWVRVGGLAVLIMMFAGVMGAISGKMFEMKWLSYLGVAVMLTGPFAALVFIFLNATRPRKRAPGRTDTPSEAPGEIEKAPTTRKLLPETYENYIPSIVEDTTDLLVTAKRRERR